MNESRMEGAGRPHDAGALDLDPGVAELVRGWTQGLEGGGEEGAVRALEEREVLKSLRRSKMTDSKSVLGDRKSVV